MPAVNFDYLLSGDVKQAKGGNQVVYWSRPVDWKNQTLTPNPDAIYFMPFFNTKDVGPVVLEIPPADGGSITGSVDDAWQTALEDVGPAGVDKGKGGKYLILPPGYKDKVPDGYIALAVADLRGYALLRSNPRERKRRRRRQGGRVRQARQDLSARRRPPTRRRRNSSTRSTSSSTRTIPYDLRFFESLDRFVQHEPWLERDKAMIDMLKSIGIEKGKPFNPERKTRQSSKTPLARRTPGSTAGTRTRTSRRHSTRAGTGRCRHCRELSKADRRTSPIPTPIPSTAAASRTPMAYFSPKHLGAGQFYLMTIKDKDGKPFDGGNTYRLTVPANAPVEQYWSATAYDRATHALIRDMTAVQPLLPEPGLQKNADGSVDIYFGPKAPAGKEANWVPTSAERQVRSAVPLLRPRESAVRQDVETAGHRKVAVNGTMSSVSIARTIAIAYARRRMSRGR